MEQAPLVLVEEDDGILIVTLNRPEKYNAINIAMMRTFSDAVDRLRDTPELKIMLIRSTGKYFSAGADLKESRNERPKTGSGIREMHRRMPSDMRRIWDEMEAIEKPFVVAHQGPCVGGGLEMSLSCDFRLASTNARYAFPEGKFAILPATNGVSRLTRMVGASWARYLVMANMEVDAEEARMMGLVHKVFPAETFDEQVMAFCRHLARQNSEQMGTAKIAIELARDLGAHQAASVERLANSALMLMPDYSKIHDAHVSNIGKGTKGG
ncbi:enoyl-CoA hydratase/isomerase family protein [Novosphingobium sp. CF614]|uniref:enoyl-CoA hydratase/isomerase family protein n=1 Tax=Novosphingobium sp. CF614 TaxID=1884364 RepID=UPI000B805702|nr:enoyl-CoA hydratase/isomerase family protein [Novosphingobium sp. CF614]